MARALVLLSGGLDSTVALWWALDRGMEAVALSFRYPGRPRGEERAAREVATRAGLRLREADVPFLLEARDADPHRFARAPPGYVPSRNALFYAAACHHAQILGCEAIVGGHNAEDAACYPDASAAFFADLERLLLRGLWVAPGAPPPRLVMPLLGLTKDEVLALGERLGAPVERTWSCYEDGGAPCLACPACLRLAPLARKASRAAQGA